jgi:hypothetical protein
VVVVVVGVRLPHPLVPLLLLPSPPLPLPVVVEEEVGEEEGRKRWTSARPAWRDSTNRGLLANHRGRRGVALLPLPLLPTSSSSSSPVEEGQAASVTGTSEIVLPPALPPVLPLLPSLPPPRPLLPPPVA